MTQLFGLGNAIVDVEVNVEDAFLTAQNPKTPSLSNYYLYKYNLL